MDGRVVRSRPPRNLLAELAARICATRFGHDNISQRSRSSERAVTLRGPMLGSNAGSSSPSTAVEMSAYGFIASSRASGARRCSPSAMSVLVMTRRSATAACFTASGIVSSCPMPFTASTSVTTPSSRYCAPSRPSLCSVCSTGTGSASPVVSTNTRSKSITSPARRLTNSSRSVSCRSVRTVQHRQPFDEQRHLLGGGGDQLVVDATSPNSLMITAARFMPGWRSSRRSSVVLPLPRKPVMTVTGSRPASGSRRQRAHGLRASDSHLQDVQAAGEAVDGVDDAPVVDVDVVQLDRAGCARASGAPGTK